MDKRNTEKPEHNGGRSDRKEEQKPRNLSVGAAGKHRVPGPGSAHPAAEVTTVKLLHIANHLSSGAKQGQ